MLLFASGRTDIPAFYSEWLLKRLRAGFVDVRNPYSHQQVTRYALDPKLVDCLVFCTKNPAPILPRIEEIRELGFKSYFFVTLTPYGKEIEPNVPEKNAVLEAVRELAEKVGPQNVCWRYDPIFVSGEYPVSFHIKAFREYAQKLQGATSRCVISFIDLYEKTKKNFPSVREVSESDQIFIAQAFSKIARENDMTIESCAEKVDLSAYGVEKGACVSKQVIESAVGFRIKEGLHKQILRNHCLCLPTRDIGAYNSCPHGCRYCYANYDKKSVDRNFAAHNPDSTFLIGGAEKGDILKEAKQESWRDFQMFLI